MASSCELAESSEMWLLRQTTEHLDPVSPIGTSTRSLESMASPCERAEDSGMWLVRTTVELTMQLFSENRDLESADLLL
ncbi:hypothetical protein N7467_007765 [Penicillium canescens]|nr:hypothetical protein N7467_007765 [Penicillium canescens]